MAGAKVPVTLLTGFLGSGKTTVLNGLLRHPQLHNTAVVVNEFGEVGLDHLLVRSADENIVLLDAGCLCCTIHDTLRETLGELWLGRVREELPSFERLVIETTGLAEPGPIVQALCNDPFITDHYQLDGIVTCVDAIHALQQLEQQREVAQQVAVADRLLLTKTDVVDAPQRNSVRARLAALNPAAATIEAVHGSVTPADVTGVGLYDDRASTAQVERWLNAAAYSHHHRSGGDAQAHATPHDQRIRADCFHLEHSVSWAGLAAWCDLMAEFHGDALLRVKGLIEIAETGRPVIVHGVHRVFDRPVRLDAWPSDDQRSRLVVISRDLPLRMVRETLAALRLPPGSLRPASFEAVSVDSLDTLDPLNQGLDQGA